MTLKVGDTVMLPSGGPVMTVTKVYWGHFAYAWKVKTKHFVSHMVFKETFIADCLVRVKTELNKDENR